MYIAKKKNTEINEGIPKVYVDFTDGTNTYTEWCIPQDADGLKHWIKSRLAVYNATPTINTNYVDGAPIDVSDPVITPPTQAELDKQMWFAKYQELEQLEKMEAKNFLTGPRLTILTNKMTAVKNFLDTNVKTEYLDFI